MNGNRIKHQRYLIMAETIGDSGGAILLNAAGKIVNVATASKLTSLIPQDFDGRGARVYLAYKLGYDEHEYLTTNGIKEIYFAAERNSIWETSRGYRIEGINYDEDIEHLRTAIQSSGDGPVSDS